MIAELQPIDRRFTTVAVLQWGRDQMIAELGLPGEKKTKAAELQWGRDQMIAELSVTGTFSRIDRLASMGPRSDDRGIMSPWIVRTPGHVSFNGAAIR